MTKIRWVLCGLVLAFGACAEVSTEGDQSQASPSTYATVQSVTRSTESGVLLSTETETCTTTESACKIGQCELGPHDTFVTLTEVCCTPSGSCTTERYRLCGC